MVETFVVCGTRDEVRKKLEPIWEIADSVCLVPPFGGPSPEKLSAYAAAIADTFYT